MENSIKDLTKILNDFNRSKLIEQLKDFENADNLSSKQKKLISNTIKFIEAQAQYSDAKDDELKITNMVKFGHTPHHNSLGEKYNNYNDIELEAELVQAKKESKEAEEKYHEIKAMLDQNKIDNSNSNKADNESDKASSLESTISNDIESDTPLFATQDIIRNKNLNNQSLFYENAQTKEIVDLKIDNAKELGYYEFAETKSVFKISYIPGHWEMVEYRYHSYKTLDNKIVSASRKMTLLGESMFTPEAIAAILINRIIMDEPYYRQCEFAKRQGIMLYDSSICNAIMRIFPAFIPLLNYMRDDIRKALIVRADETPIDILDIKQQKDPTKVAESWIWVYSTGYGEIPIYVYQIGPSHSQKHPQKFFGKGKRKFLICDGLEAYKTIADLYRVPCFAHTMRKFMDAINAKCKQASVAQTALDYFGKIFFIEANIQIEHKENYDEIKKQREIQIRPVWNKLKEFITNLKIDPTLAIGKARTYFMNQCDDFENFFKDGHLELTNNASERAVKTIVQGRKNWLFAKSEYGGEMTCGFYSLVQTCLVNNVDPFDYLVYLIENLPEIKKPIALKSELPEEDKNSRKKLKELEKKKWEEFKDNGPFPKFDYEKYLPYNEDIKKKFPLKKIPSKKVDDISIE